MKIALALFVVVASSTLARADAPRWFEQFYAYTGYRHVEGLERSSSRSWGVGYRVERATWGIDVALVNVQHGNEEGLHELARVTGYVMIAGVPGMWIGGGGSYAQVNGWTDSAVAGRKGHGLVLDVVGGFDLPSASMFRPFIQIDLAVPLFTARDHYGSKDSAIRVVGAEIAIGVRL